MGAIIRDLVAAVREAFAGVVRGIFHFIEVYREINAPPTRRRQLINIRSRMGTLYLVSLEEGPEFTLYIFVQNEQGDSIIEAIVHQNTIQEPNCEVEATWTEPRTGNSGRVVRTYPIDARAIMDLLF